MLQIDLAKNLPRCGRYFKTFTPLSHAVNQVLS